MIFPWFLTNYITKETINQHQFHGLTGGTAVAVTEPRHFYCKLPAPALLPLDVNLISLIRVQHTDRPSGVEIRKFL